MITDAEKGAIVAIGTFDGVHVGHQALLDEALRIKSRTGLPVIVVTFHPHPRFVMGLQNEHARLLTPPVEKAALVQDYGADRLVTLPFTRELSSMEPRRFIEKYLISAWQTKYVVCGFSFTFGHKGVGNPSYLAQLGPELGFEVRVIPAVSLGGDLVSSSRVRLALAEGRPEEAAACLGRPYGLQGVVSGVCGKVDGSSRSAVGMRVPEDKLLPCVGAYAAFVRIAGPSVTPEPEMHPSFIRGAQASSDTGETASPKGPIVTVAETVVNVGSDPSSCDPQIIIEQCSPGFSADFGSNRGAEQVQAFLISRLSAQNDGPSIDEAGDVLRRASSFTLPRAYDRMLASDVP